MRVKIQRGSASIEAEGEYSEIEQLLSRWWSPAGQSPSVDEEISAVDVDVKKTEAKRSVKRQSKKGPRPANSFTENTFDVSGLVNRMKEDPRYETFLSKIIIPPSDAANKAKFVSWFSHETPLTSGTAHRVLDSLGVKIDASTISRAISQKSKHDYIIDKTGPQPTYKLTARAYDLFSKWMTDVV